MSNRDTIQLVYAAFQRGDIAFILDQISEEAVWEGWPGNSAQEAGVPWMLERRGPEGVASFFQVLADMEFSRFDVAAVLEGDGYVAGVIAFEMVYKPTGKRVRDEEMHLFRFADDGKIISFRHYLDTAKHIEAARG